jgi:hypothetical protein
MNLIERINAFSELGNQINRLNKAERVELADRATQKNAWFTLDSVTLALDGISKFLSNDILTKWTSRYSLDRAIPKTIGVAMAGNIPLVGFHDFLCVLLSGNKLKAKLSSQDSVLLQYLTKILIQADSRFEPLINYAERLNEVDAVIATGSDNTSRYFEYYFRNIPHIIRKNRSSCAVLMGEESKDQLTALGKDVFSYFGLGCRNVAKIFVPDGYNFSPLLDSWNDYSGIIHHHKYANNYDYQKSILLVNGVSFLDNGFVLVTEHSSLVSPISVLFYETYSDQEDLQRKIETQRKKIQCIVSANAWYKESLPTGKAQYPEVWDYADDVDTMKFLSAINR